MISIDDFDMFRVGLSTGVELDVVDIGQSDAPVLIFLHGFPESHRTWRFQLLHFSKRFRCIAPDQRGYCGSSKPQEVEAYTPDKLTADIFALADALGIDRFTIVGHDWGGAIAWNVALRGQPNAAPEAAQAGRVERAIILNAPHPALFQQLMFSNREQRAASQYMRAFRDPAHDSLIREKGLAGLLAKVVRWDEAAPSDADERKRLLKNWQGSETAFAMLNWYRASPLIVPDVDEPFESPALPSPTAPDSFPKLTIPTLVIWGLEDKALVPANLDGLEHYVPQVSKVPLAGYGHFTTWQAAQEVNTAMEAFLSAT